MTGDTNEVLYTLNTTTGAATRVGSSTAFGSNVRWPNGLASVGGTLYLVDRGNNALYSLHTTTGAATRIGTSNNFGVSETDPIALGSIGNTLYMVGQDNRILYSLDIIGTPGRAGIAPTERVPAVTYRAARPAGLIITPPSDPLDTWGFDSPVSPWFDGAPSLTTEQTTLFRAQRKILGDPDKGDVIRDLWQESKVVGHYGQDGTIGIDGIPGIDGVPGQDGATGARGSPGVGYEFIYALTNGLVPSVPLNTWGYDQPISPWQDDPGSITETLTTQWVAVRRVPGLPEAGDVIVAEWGTPEVYSHYGTAGRDGTDGTDGTDGIDGADGEDGAGIEYVFRTTDGTVPDLPSNTFTYDLPVAPWTDGAPSLTAQQNTIFRAQRKIVGTPAVGDVVPAQWGGLGAVAHQGADGVAGADGAEGRDGTDGTDGADGQDGIDGIAGADGEDGAGLEYVFASTDGSGVIISGVFTPTLPSLPLNSWGFDQPRGVWTDDAPTLTDTKNTLFRSQRKIVGTPAVGSAVTDTWTTPKGVGRHGVDGVAGVAATSYYTGYIYRRSINQPTNPAGGSFNFTTDILTPPRNWEFIIPAGNDQLWVSFQVFSIQGDTGLANSVSWSTPARTASGIDGVGLEQAYASTTTETMPIAPNRSWGYKSYTGSTWHTQLQSLSTTAPYVWASFRPTIGIPAIGASVTGVWGPVGLVSRLGPRGVAGVDGFGFEYIFYRTTGASVRPPAPSNSWGYDRPANGWLDNHPGLSDTYIAIWWAYRRVHVNVRPGDAVSALWVVSGAPISLRGATGVTGPTGEKGNKGDDGEKGTDGFDLNNR